MKQTLISTLEVAGEELLKYFGKSSDFTIKESQSSIVTIADIKSDNLIVKIIRDRYPDHSVISEESGFSKRNSKYTWVIDPLDGTSNFASGIPWFGVMITIFENNTPLMAGVYLPYQKIIYFAEKNGGSYRNGLAFRMDTERKLKDSLVSFSVDYTDDKKVLDNSLRIFRNIIKSSRNIRSTNSLVDFLYVAEGKFGGCVNLMTRIWDISGLGLIISEAGGIMKDINGEDLHFSLDRDPSGQNFAVVTGSVERVKELINSVL